MKKAIIIGMLVIIASTSFINCGMAQPTFPLTVYGVVYHQGQNGSQTIVGITVYAKNQRTNEILTAVTSAGTGNKSGGYVITITSMSNLQVGDNIEIYAYRTLDGHTYSASTMFIYTFLHKAGNITIERRDLVFPAIIEGNGNGGGNGTPPPPPPPPPGDNSFMVYGTVKDSQGNKANNSNVTIKNMKNNEIGNTLTNNYGNYSFDLHTLPSGWKVGDIIFVTATYKTGAEREYGWAPYFDIFSGMKDKRVNIEMVVVGDENNQEPGNKLPDTYEGLLAEYYKLLNNLNNTKAQNEAYKEQIKNLNEMIEEIEDNTYTKEEVDQMIANAVRDAERGGTNYLAIMLAIIILVLVLYFLYEKGMLPIGKNKQNFEETEKKRRYR